VRTGLVDTNGQGPLCPRSGVIGPQHPLHALQVQMIDAAYAATPTRADNGEPADPAAGLVLDAVSASPPPGGMALYRAAVVAAGEAVEALWFQCPVCGFVLPANRREVNR
jgi:hypothetical protein